MFYRIHWEVFRFFITFATTYCESVFVFLYGNVEVFKSRELRNTSRSY